jgi:hypothetical protein
MISQIKLDSGNIIVIGLNNDFKLSGSSDLPSYPGFIVINKPIVGQTVISFFKISILGFALIKAS